MLAELALVYTQLTFVYFYSSDVDALVAEIMAKEPLVTRSKAGQVKGLIESEFADTLETAKTLLCISGQFVKSHFSM